MLKKISAFILFFLLLIFGLVILGFVLLNSSQLIQKAGPALIHRNFKDIKINHLFIEEQSFDLSGTLAIKGINMQLGINNDLYDLDVDSIIINGRNFLSSARENLLADVKGLALSSEIFKIQKADINFVSAGEQSRLGIIGGNFLIHTAQYLDYQAKNITGDFIKNLEFAIIKNLQAEFYGGQLTGEIVLANQPDLDYSIKAKMLAVDLKLLEESNPAFFSKIKGKVAGHIDITGNMNGDSNVQADFWSTEGGEIKASLLRPLLEYIPQSTQKRELSALIERNGDVPLDTAFVKVESSQGEKIFTRLDLESKKFNLDVDLNLDFNIEGGAAGLIKLQKQHFLKRR